VNSECYNRIGVMGDGTCPELETAVHCRNCPVFVAAGEKLFEREPPAEYVEEQTRQLAKEVSAETTDTVAVAVFRIGEEWLAFAVHVVAEVTQRRTVHLIPHRSGRRLMGLVNIRGELQLCVSLGDLLGIEPGDEAPAENSSHHAQECELSSTGRLLVTEHGSQRWVFPVDEVAGIHRVGVDRLADLPATVAKNPKRFSRAVFDWDGKSVGYLAEDRVFDSLQGSLR
jgi:chemotaxis-related protein WspD